ncbi:MAG: hypothetical protein CBB87_02495 [Micavibrio sp. TMED27]|nr:hypothetical protein [Micavibrio sp.]OUT92192.1 MAG: hypothetical protein CBB87_02495 [Micavibrio sp. TMED27]|tara:strand:- start:1817 stop:2146 length:330 start_codon:yes stop_codon:yes gene_type:complete
MRNIFKDITEQISAKMESAGKAINAFRMERHWAKLKLAVQENKMIIEGYDLAEYSSGGAEYGSAFEIIECDANDPVLHEYINGLKDKLRSLGYAPDEQRAKQNLDPQIL